MRSARLLGAFALLPALLSCSGGGVPSKMAVPPGFEPPGGGSKCGVTLSQAAPLSDASAMRTRLVLAAFLLRVEHTGLSGDFPTFASAPLLSIATRLHWPSGDHDAHRLLRGALASLRRLDTTADIPRLLSVYRHLIGRPPIPKLTTLDDIAARDPLAAAFPASPSRALPETRFLASALRYLDNTTAAGRDDPLFASLFWPYVRIRTRLYQHLTAAPQTSGLDRFALHYDRISALRRGLDPVLADGALRHAARGLRLISLEARTAPPSSWVGIRDAPTTSSTPAASATPRASSPASASRSSPSPLGPKATPPSASSSPT